MKLMHCVIIHNKMGVGLGQLTQNRIHQSLQDNHVNLHQEEFR